MPDNYRKVFIFPTISVKKSEYTYLASSIEDSDTYTHSHLYPLNFDCLFIDYFYLDWSPTFSVCNQQQYQNYFTRLIDDKEISSRCSEKCKQCDSNGKCLECHSFMYLMYDECFLCDSSCNGCNELSYNCTKCPFLVQIKDYSHDSIFLKLCENCLILNCKICLYNLCFFCDDGFTYINFECVDCTLDINSEICFPKLKKRYLSPLLFNFKSKIVDKGISQFIFTSCDQSDDFVKCETCRKNTNHKYIFLECFYFPKWYERKELTNLANQKILKSFTTQTLIAYFILKEIKPINITTKNILQNCIFLSPSDSECLLCNEGFYLYNSKCFPCKVGCAKCSSNVDCDYCFPEFKKVTNKTDENFCQNLKLSVSDQTKCKDIQIKFPNSILSKSKFIKA